MLKFSNVAAMMEQKKAAMDSALETQQNTPIMQGLSGHIHTFWNKAKHSKINIENQMLEAVYSRRGEYTPEKLSQVMASKQPPIYMMLAASKMRQIDALVRDILQGTGEEKPWTLNATPSPDLDPQTVDSLVISLKQEIETAMNLGIYPSQEQVRERLRTARDELTAQMKEEARIKCERMENKMEDQLIEGGFRDAIDGFISDLSTFKTAFIKGPVVRNKPQLAWGPDGQLNVTNTLSLEWERVDPFNVYPAPWARTIRDGAFIEKHKMTREELTQLIGVEGYSEAAIRKVIEEYGATGLNNWLAIDTRRAAAEGKTQIGATSGNELIDALQYWGSASGHMLIDWGMDKKQVPDPEKEYQIEAWLIGDYVIKAVLNADPLARRPYYSYSFQPIPGSVWGNSPYDLMKDCQDMCNAAARALAANLGISSGPQVAILSNRLPPGEDVSEMYPWKIWQFESDPMGNTASPISFFQPTSNAEELMRVYDRFSQLADEYTGIPRYMAGFSGDSGGAGRTASGMSMMIGNASKIIKQVLGGIDNNIFTPLLERLYYYNMRYSDDVDLKGDVRVVARGATSLQVREAAQQFRNQFLQVTANPIDMQIIGMDGRGEVLREAAKSLDMDVDKVVPPIEVLKERQAIAMAQQQQQAAANIAQAQNAAQNPQPGGSGGDAPVGPTPPPALPGQQGSQQALPNPNPSPLMSGQPQTNHFLPAKGP
jgi:phage anti-repressor protein